MEIKDYLHFYIGCNVFESFNNRVCKLTGVDTDKDLPVLTLWEGKGRWTFSYDEVKPILRKLSDMTEKDGLAIFGSETKYLLYRKEARELGADLWLFTANEYTRLLKAGFDCHDLIPNGLAIDNKSL